MRLVYQLRIEVPNEIDPGTLDDIRADAEPHDTTLSAKIERWIGGDVSDAETALSDALPEGWYAAIDSLYADGDDD